MRFTVVTVCLNEVTTIRRTCESLCHQSYDDFEWIVIDGQSTDGTLAALDDYASHITQLVSEPDNGIYDAMNKGIARAKGDYLLFLNAGDSLADTKTLETVSQGPGCDLLFGDLRCISATGEVQVKSFPDMLPRHYLVRNMLPHQASYFHRRVFDKYGGYESRWQIAGDYELFVRLIYRYGISYHHIPEVVAEFHMDGVSSHAAQRQRRRLENHQIRWHYFPWYVYGWKGLKAEWRRRLSR
jgi:glycosyltransferase involved in cell wall biosynthesis